MLGFMHKGCINISHVECTVIVSREELLPSVLNQIWIQHGLEMLELYLLQLGGQLAILFKGLDIEAVVCNFSLVMDLG